MDTGSVLGLAGVILAVGAIVVVFVIRDIDREKKLAGIESGVRDFNDHARDLISSGTKLLREVGELVSAQQLRPDLSGAFANQWRFIEKTFHNRFDKHAICRRIVREHLSKSANILLDSGSTVDLVTHELLAFALGNVHVYSNNVFAAMHLVGTKEISFHLFEGVFSDNFAAVYSDDSNHRMRSLGIDVFILAATAMRFDQGVMVNQQDLDNRDFKRCALQAFERAENAKLILALDASKFVQPLADQSGVVDHADWAEIVKKCADRIVIVTSPPPSDLRTEERVAIEREWEAFRAAGVTVDVWSARAADEPLGASPN